MPREPRVRASVPFREPALSLRDILDGIDKIAQFVLGMDLEAFREDPKTVAAVERKLLLMSEAAVRLGEDADRLCPGLPWHNIRGIGNWLRHRYDMTRWPSRRCGTRSSMTFRRSGLGSCAR